jgi:multidrug efflux pump subunit AcrB
MSQQAQNDVDAAVRGYDYQQASALEQLRNNLEQRLAGLEGQQVDVQSQLAGAQLQGRQGVMQANYGEIQQRQAQAAALREAQARAAGTAEAARIRAEADANKPIEYPEGVLGWDLKVTDAGGNPNEIRERLRGIVAKLRAADKKKNMPTRQQINQRYQRLYGDQGDAGYANELVKLIY